MPKKYNEVRRMQAQERRAVQRKQDLDVISVRRNPYLVDFEEERRLRRAANESFRRPSGQAAAGNRRTGGDVSGRSRRRSVEVPDVRSRKAAEAGDRKERRTLESTDQRNRRVAEVANREDHRFVRERDKRSYESLDLIDIGHGRRRAGKSVNRPVRPAQKSTGRQVRTAQGDRKQNPAAAWKLAKRRRRKQRIRR